MIILKWGRLSGLLEALISMLLYRRTRMMSVQTVIKDCAGHTLGLYKRRDRLKRPVNPVYRKPFINTVTINAKIADIYASG